MRKTLCSLLLIASITVSAQQSSMKGKIVDTLEKKNLQHAVVSILKKSDSTLVKFTRSGKDGSFLIDNIIAGRYIMMVSYPQFADYTDEIEVQAGKETNLGRVPLTLRTKLLETVIVRSRSAVRIKGDTTEFIADSFKVKDGATVEDLLKRLPGFQVNSKGEITAQGQRVGKVLVDGEEFFGDDPTMATQNISAKAVDKVQVYDTKSDQQNLTGISAGSEGKTVNIKLKEDAKKGSFGKAHAGSDFEDLVDAKILFNRFVGKQKFSVYGTTSDISTGSLNWEDRQKLGIENDFEYDEISGYYYSFGTSDEFNDWSLRGLPDSYTGGMLYSNKWNGDKHGINGSYRYNRLGTVNDASTMTQNLLENSTTYRNKFQHSQGLVQQHSPNLKYEWKLDSLASFKFSVVATYKTNELISNINSEFLDSAQNYINNSLQEIDNHAEKKQAENQFQYKQLFKKKNRVLMATLRYGYIEDDQTGIVKTHTRFYKNGLVDSTDLADQQKIVNGHSTTMGGKLSYVEPFTQKWSLVAEVGYNKNNSISHRNTYNKDGDGKYSMRDSVFSNNFDMDAFAYNSSLIFKYTSQKFRAAFGSGVSSLELKLYNIDKAKKDIYHFLNLTPQLSTSITFKPQTRLNFNYKGTTRNPTIEQLQPIRDNQDRLNIFVGNPHLKVSFNHSFNLSYNSYKVLTQKGVYMSVYYNLPINAISFLNAVDVTLGQQIYTPVNVNGNRSYNSWFSYFKDGGEKKLGYEIHASVSGGDNNNYIHQEDNGLSYNAKNKTTYLNSDVGFDLRYDIPDKFNLEFGPKTGYNISNSTLQKDYNTKYWTYGGDIEFRWNLFWKMELASDCEFDMRQQLEAFAGNPNQIIWNASLSKKLFRKGNGKIYLLTNDILNQKKGFNRNINSNFITEERYSRISRYFLLKFEWSFSKMPGQESNK